MPFQKGRGQEGEREKREGEGEGNREKKRKREVTTVVRKVPIEKYMGVHDDSTPYNNCTRNLLW